jgi:putative hydrolase
MAWMSEQSRGEPGDVPIGDVLGDIPLLREIQRVLLASTGPVNWELARQVGIAVASYGTEDPAPTEEDRRGLADTVRAAELAVADFTGLPAASDLTEVMIHRRGQWVEANIAALRDVMEPVAARLGTALDEQQAARLPEILEGQEMLATLMGRMVPLLTGAQMGMALGYLGQRVMGQFDLPLPRTSGHLSFVVSNIRRFESEWSLAPLEFRAWVSLHEVIHRLEFAGSWVHGHFGTLVRDLAEHAEIDLSELERGLEGLDLSSPEAIGRAFEGMGNLFGQASTAEQSLRVARVRAFLAAAEGYGDHVMDRVGRRMLPSYGQISEAVRRHREGGTGERALERLLGLAIDPEHYRLGRDFSDRVAELTDEPTLARIWESAEALPSMPELEEPSLWLSRMA